MQIMDAANIIYLLRRLGKSQAQLARELSVSNGVISNVIHNRITSFAVASHIAAILDSEVGELWPNRYVFKPRGRMSHSEQPKRSVDGGAS